MFGTALIGSNVNRSYFVPTETYVLERH